MVVSLIDHPSSLWLRSVIVCFVPQICQSSPLLHVMMMIRQNMIKVRINEVRSDVLSEASLHQQLLSVTLWHTGSPDSLYPSVYLNYSIHGVSWESRHICQHKSRLRCEFIFSINLFMHRENRRAFFNGNGVKVTEFNVRCLGITGHYDQKWHVIAVITTYWWNKSDVWP